MSNRIPSTPRRQSQSETDTETSSLVSSPSASEQSSASEEGSEKSAQAPVMKSRKNGANSPKNSSADTANSGVASRTNMKSSSPRVTNRQTGDQKRARYGQARDLPAYQRGAHIGRGYKFEKEMTADGKLIIESSKKFNMGDLITWFRTSPASLREISFNQHFIFTNSELKALAQILQGDKTLTTLTFFCSPIGDSGAAALAEALKVNTMLKVLNLIHTDIEKTGAAALADALQVNTTLNTLQLSNNYFGWDGVKALGEALKINTSLTTLDLSWTAESNDPFYHPIPGGDPFFSDGAKSLAEDLKVNKTLKTLSLQGNHISGDDAKALTESLEFNAGLTNLNLRNNRFGKESASQAVAAIAALLQ